MAGLSLLTLLDDIVAVLDDVALMSKVAVKKTAGVLGDDIALNAQQVAGVNADRELPVVWAVAKGSFINKAIIVPIALILSALLPTAILVLLMLGGLYLCFEGFEKVFHSLFHKKSAPTETNQARLSAQTPDEITSFEKEKIKGAIRTDFILSAEIIVIALGTVSDADFLTQVLVVVSLAIALTIGVYGLVAAIVKLDDLGLHLLKVSQTTSGKLSQLCSQFLGRGLLAFAPQLMRGLVIVGTAAMFLVGGGILIHGISPLAEFIHQIEHFLASLPTIGATLAYLAPTLLTAVVGIIAGGLTLIMVKLVSLFTPAPKA